MQTQQRQARLNIKRGLNRIFVILWALYAMAVLAYPLYMDSEAMNGLLSLSNASFNTCIDAHGDNCQKEHANDEATILEKFNYGSSYREIGWNLLWVLPLALLAFPAAVYGCILISIRTAAWVFHGFRTSS